MICIDCAKREPIKHFILSKSTTDNCNYCGKEKRCSDIRDVFKYIFECVENNCITKDDLTPYEYALIFDCGSNHIASASIDIVLQDWFDLRDECYYSDLDNSIPAKFLHDKENHSVVFIEDDGSLDLNIYEKHWEKFITHINHNYRFFNVDAYNFLEEIFSILSDNSLIKKDYLKQLNIGDAVYRARKVNDYKQAKEFEKNLISELGAPPPNLATDQRMTPAGISGLYCALERNTCLSEIRANTGDYVLSVQLTATKKIDLLDLTTLTNTQNPEIDLLQKGMREELHKVNFIKNIIKKLSKPKGDANYLHYMSTQFIFEYFRKKYGSQVAGIVYPSVQTGGDGTNIIFFPEFNTLEEKNVQRRFSFGIQNPFDNSSQCLLNIEKKSVRYHKIKAINVVHEEFPDQYQCFFPELFNI